MKKNIFRIISVLLICVLLVGALSACGKSEGGKETEKQTESAGGETDAQTEPASGESETKGTETEAPDEDAIGKIGDDFKIDKKATYFYYLLYKTQYEQYYGITDWTVEMSEGYTYGDYLKEQVENQMTQVVYLSNLADKYDIQLDDETKATVESTTDQYWEMLSEEEWGKYGITKDDVRAAFTTDYRAGEAINRAIEDEVKELTDEEIESVSYKRVAHILFLTEEETEPAETESQSEGESESEGESQTETKSAAEKNAEQLKLAEEIRQRALDGEDFLELAEEYTQDSNVEYAINKDGYGAGGVQFVSEFAEAANALGEGEISEIVKTQYGYHIIKCTALVDEEATEQGKKDLGNEKLYNKYLAWLDENPYEYYDEWKNLVVENPEIPETESGSEPAVESETVPESESESEAAE